MFYRKKKKKSENIKFILNSLTFKYVPAATDDEEFSVQHWIHEIRLTCAIARADTMMLMSLMFRHAVE